MKEEIENNKGEIIIYQSEDGKIKLDVRLENKTVWLTQEQIAQLYSKGRSMITEHISNIFKEGELEISSREGKWRIANLWHEAKRRE